MVYVPRKRRRRPLSQGDRVRVVGHVGADSETGRNVELHGDAGQVVGANPHYTHPETGERMTAVELDDGSIAAVPRRALKRET